jgi:predicted transcriptional regulator
VKLIKANPGISASEVAKKMRIKPNYLYRVLGDLQKEGRVKKSGRSYTAARITPAAATPSATREPHATDHPA